MNKLYLAGSLFNKAERNERIREGNLLEQMTNYSVFNPIAAPCNDKSKLPTASDIFWGDTREVLSSDVIVADISNPADLGVAAELGIAWACNHIHSLAEEGRSLEDILSIMKSKDIYCHLSDIRKDTAHCYQGHHVPLGTNQYLVGMVESTGVIRDEFDDILNELAMNE